MDNLFKSLVFPTQDIFLGGIPETVLQGGRNKFPLAATTLLSAGVNEVLILGWGSQGPAQALNWEEAMEGTGISVSLGLREGSDSIEKAKKAGFKGTIGEMYSLIPKADLVILLIKDSAQVENYEQILGAMKSGATLGLSHGFLLGHVMSIGKKFRDDINIVGVCPKGMGPSVRRLFIQGRDTEGAGINCSFAVEQDINGKATDIALAWAIAIGAPWIFKTTLEKEYLSDLVGERLVLLGTVHAIVEALYVYFITEGHMTEEDAFKASVENVTGPLSRIISKEGLIGVFNRFTGEDKDCFERAFSVAYQPFFVQFHEVYDEVASGNEIRGVVMAGKRMDRFDCEMPTIDDTRMWQVGKKVRASRSSDRPLETMNPITAGIYCAAIMAQIDLLLEKGHFWSEICNETVIEAVDSLNPFMHFKGVAEMIDGCSTTARLGARRWAPIVQAIIGQVVLVKFMADGPVNTDIIGTFKNHPIHDALAICAKMRPSVDISVTG